MKAIFYVLASLSAIGLVLSLASHIAALLGTQGLLGDSTSMLHLGAMAVAIPAVLIANRLGKNAPIKTLWRTALRGCPSWMRYTTYAFLVYAVLNFVLFALTASKAGGTGPMPPREVRGFSGHWMAFYSVSLAVYYSAAHLWDQGWDCRCPSGHTVPPFANFCSQCGQPITDPGSKLGAR